MPKQPPIPLGQKEPAGVDEARRTSHCSPEEAEPKGAAGGEARGISRPSRFTLQTPGSLARVPQVLFSTL